MASIIYFSVLGLKELKLDHYENTDLSKGHDNESQ